MKKTLVRALLLVGCGGKPEATDSFVDLDGLDQKSDAFSSRMKVMGTMIPGQTSASVRYSKSPSYRAFQLNAKGPAQISITVRSTDGGDALTWLLSSHYRVLAKNDDADASTLDSHIVYDLPAGGATYWVVFRDYNWSRHGFVVEVAPYKPSPAACDVGFDVPDEPPVAVSEYEVLSRSSGTHLSSFELYDGTEPDCLDWSSASVRTRVAEDIRANSGIDWQDATPPVVQGPVKRGGADFAVALADGRNEMNGYAQSSLEKSAAFTDAYKNVDKYQEQILGDSQTNPGAYLEFNLHVEAEECSQEGHVRIDTRTGAVLILRVHGC
jgi:hypothetical protein